MQGTNRVTYISVVHLRVGVCVCQGVGGREAYNITGLPSLLIGLQPCEADWGSASYAGESGGR